MRIDFEAPLSEIRINALDSLLPAYTVEIHEIFFKYWAATIAAVLRPPTSEGRQ
jgi:hypothetical protein